MCTSSHQRGEATQKTERQDKTKAASAGTTEDQPGGVRRESQHPGGVGTQQMCRRKQLIAVHCQS